MTQEESAERQALNGRYKLEFDQDKLKVLIGHTPLQVFCGAVLGIIVGLVSINLLP